MGTETDTEKILAAIAELKAEIRELKESDPPIISPWLRGDAAGAKYAGHRSRSAFRKWAVENGVRPSRDLGLNFWSRAAINKARERNMI